MKVIAHMLAFMAAIALTTGIITFVANRTVWNVEYMEKTAADTQLYESIAAGLPDLVAAGSENPAETKKLISSAVTPQLLQQQIETLVPQFVSHYREGGPVPTLDLTPFAAQLQTAGVAIPPDVQAQLATPKTLAFSAGEADATIAKAGQGAKTIDWASWVAAAVLLVLIGVIAGSGRFLVLATVGYMGGILTGILGFLVLFAPGIIFAALKDSPAKALEPGLLEFAKAVASGISNQLFIAAGILGAAAIVLTILHAFLVAKSKLIKPKPKPAKPALPAKS
ncbi:MAG: hypothetical protein K0S68_841 [Candidatus Saccharibacteria bacterium]|nr:hypothetical protein [Candidatus Saccharibacteria bacterium]